MNSLTLPNTPFDFSAINRADLQPSTKAKYTKAIQLLLLAAIDPFNFAALSAYADSLTISGKSHLKSALKIVTAGELMYAKANATPQNVDAIQALVYRLEAMNQTIHVKPEKGSKFHNWLTGEQVEQITAIPNRSTHKGMRDYILLALALGTGLRRDELIRAKFEDIKQQGPRDVLAVLGKGKKNRTVPLSAKLAKYIREWHRITGDGCILRSLKGDSLSEIGAHNIVREYGALIGVPELDCHDLRRSYAMLGLNAGIPITQISVLLGHSNIAVTQRYLNLEVDLNTTISDVIPLSGD